MRPFSPTFEYDLMLRASGADQPLPKLLQTWLQYGCSKRGSSAYRCPSYFTVFCRTLRSGGTRIRTGDTMIFSHRSYVVLRTTP
jgi:hypothetical protein